jgi:AcrR family transcriptional regulator
LQKNERSFYYWSVRKGEATKQSILDHAVRLGAGIGLEGLSIGQLADDLKLSKSGLFAHFKSKENLQIETIRRATDHFIAEVIAPALKAPRGEPRCQALFEHWLGATKRRGCFFLSAIQEFDDRPGPVRDALAKTQSDWLDTLSTAAAIAVDEGHFRKDLDSRQLAFEMYSLMMGAHFLFRFVHDKRANERTMVALERLFAGARKKRS